MERSFRHAGTFCRLFKVMKPLIRHLMPRQAAGFLFFSVFIVTPLATMGQTEDLAGNIAGIAEELAGDDSGQGSLEEFTERLLELAGNPVEVNSDKTGELDRLFFLSDFQLKIIAGYRSEYGPIKTIYELANIPGFDRATAEMMAPFITFTEKQSNSATYTGRRNSLLTSASLRSTDRESSGMGSPWKFLAKYRFSISSFSGGITAEKDAGERLPGKGSIAPDFTSAFLCYSGTGVIKKVIAGDFGIRFGMGSTLNTGIVTGLSLTSPGYMSGRNEIRPHTSSDEYNFFRGVAAEAGRERLVFTGYYSDNLVDASQAGTAGDSSSGIKSIYSSGLHNTPLAQMKKDRLREINYGASVSYDLRNLRLGLLWSETRFITPDGIAPTDKDPYSFSGNINRNVCFTYKAVSGNIISFGEFSVNNGDSYALVQGLSLRPSGRLTVNLLYRNYSPGYTAFHGRAPGTISRTENEQGFTGNFTLEAARYFFASAGYNFSYYPWIKYRTSFPSYSKAGEIRLRYEPSTSFNLELSGSYRESVTDNDAAGTIPGQSSLETLTFRFIARYGFSENLSLVTRLYCRKAAPGGRMGTVLSQDLICAFPSVPLRLWLRFSPFNTDDWDTRLYVYENDLLQSYSIPALSGCGCRSYAMLRWDATPAMKIIMKYGMNLSFRGAGDNSFRDDFRIQLSLKF